MLKYNCEKCKMVKMDWDKLWPIWQMLVQVLPPQIFPTIIVRHQSCLGGKMHSRRNTPWQNHSLAQWHTDRFWVWPEHRTGPVCDPIDFLQKRILNSPSCTFLSYPGMFEARNRIRFIMEPIWTWPRTIQNNLEHDQRPGSRFWSWPGKPVSGRWTTEAALNVCLLQPFFCLSLCLVAHNQKHNQ